MAHLPAFPPSRFLPRNRTVYATLALASLALYLLVQLVLQRNYLTHFCEVLPDYKLIELNVLNAAHFEALTGAYSRFGFRHPGPIAFYWYALFDPAVFFLRSEQARSAVAEFILNLGCIAAIALISLKMIRPRWLCLAWTPLILLVMRGHDYSAFATLSNVWNPYVGAVPMTLLLVSGAAAAAGRAHYLWLFSLAGVLAVHSHLGALPCVAAAALATGALMLRRWQMHRPFSGLKKGLLAAAAIIAVTSAPIAVDMLKSGNGGNVEAIANFVRSSHRGISARHAVKYFSSHFAKPLKPWLDAKGKQDTVVCALLFLFVWLPFAPRSPFFRQLRLLSSAVSIAAFLSIMRIQGTFLAYLIIYQFGISAAIWFLAIWRVFVLLRRFFPAAKIPERAVAAVAAAVFCLAPLLFVGPVLGVDHYCTGRFAAPQKFLEALPHRYEHVRYEFSFNRQCMDLLVDMAILLRQRDISFCILEPKYAYLFDRTLICGGSEPAETKSIRITFQLTQERNPSAARGRFTSGGLSMRWGSIRRHRQPPLQSQI